MPGARLRVQSALSGFCTGSGHRVAWEGPFPGSLPGVSACLRASAFSVRTCLGLSRTCPWLWCLLSSGLEVGQREVSTLVCTICEHTGSRHSTQDPGHQLPSDCRVQRSLGNRRAQPPQSGSFPATRQPQPWARGASLVDPRAAVCGHSLTAAPRAG